MVPPSNLVVFRKNNTFWGFSWYMITCIRGRNHNPDCWTIVHHQLLGSWLYLRWNRTDSLWYVYQRTTYL